MLLSIGTQRLAEQRSVLIFAYRFCVKSADINFYYFLFFNKLNPIMNENF